MVSLIQLPEDILFYVASFLSVLDILSLKQCCRILHTFGSADYLWHRLIDKLDLPLEIPPETPVISKPAEELQRLAIRAIQLEHNWRRKTSHIRNLWRIQEGSDESFIAMHLLPGGRWLFTAHHYRRLLMTRYTTRASVWWLGDNRNARQVFNVEVTANLRTSAFAFQYETAKATVVLALYEDDREYLEIYAVPLREDSHATQSYLASTSRRQVQLPKHDRSGHQVIQELVLAGDILAVIVAVCPEGGVFFQILFVDLETGHTLWAHPRFTENFGLLQLRIQRGLIYLFDHSKGTVVIRVYHLPLRARFGGHRQGREDDGDRDYLDLGQTVAQYQHTLPDGMRTSEDALYIPQSFTSSIPVVMFDVASTSTPLAISQVGYIAYVSLQNPQEPESSGTDSVCIPFQSGSAQILVRIGTTGRRMVWLEHDLETGRNKMMKLLCRGCSQDTLYGVLIPSQPNLPFSLNTCSILAFDEASGRLCLGFYDGSIHVLDFV